MEQKKRGQRKLFLLQETALSGTKGTYRFSLRLFRCPKLISFWWEKRPVATEIGCSWLNHWCAPPSDFSELFLSAPRRRSLFASAQPIKALCASLILAHNPPSLSSSHPFPFFSSPRFDGGSVGLISTQSLLSSIFYREEPRIEQDLFDPSIEDFSRAHHPPTRIPPTLYLR